MLADIVSLLVALTIVAAPLAFFTRILLQGHAESLRVPFKIRWGALLMTTTIVGGLFASAWLVPVIYLLPADEGPQKEGPIYIAGIVIGQTLATMPIICGFPSVARRFLPSPSESDR